MTSGTVGLEINPIRFTNSDWSVCASSDLMPTTWLMPNSVDGSVPASVMSDVRSSGSGTSAPRFTSNCCIIIWPREPMARDRPSASARICWSSTRTEPVITSSAVSRSGA